MGLEHYENNRMELYMTIAEKIIESSDDLLQICEMDLE